MVNKKQKVLYKKLPSDFWFGEQMEGECMSCERTVWVKVEFDKSSEWPNRSGELITKIVKMNKNENRIHNNK